MQNIIKSIFIILLSTSLNADRNLEKLTLQLDWKYQFQYAGFLIAKEKGFYEEKGIDLTLLEYENGLNTEEFVLSKKADFGISNSPIMIKNRVIQSTVILATYLHNSPLVFVTQPNIKSPFELNGKKIMATKYEYHESSLSLLMNHFFVEGKYIPHSFGIEEFKNKEVDVMSVFKSNEIYELDKQKVPYNIIDPYEYGFISNAMNLFSSYDFAKNNTQKIELFLEATKKGWQYAIDNTDETIKIIHNKYTQNKSIEELQFESKIIKKLMLLNEYDIGEINSKPLQRLYIQLSQTNKILVNQRSKVLVFDDIKKDKNSPALFFTKEEHDYLTKKGTIKICVAPKWMPFESIQNGKHIGMIAEYFDIIKKKSNLDIQIYPTKNWEDSLNKIKKGKCDIIGSAVPTISRLKFMNFTDTYMQSPLVLITNMNQTFVNDIADIKDKKIGMMKGYASIEILKDKYPDTNIVEVTNIMDGLKKVESGALYGYIDNLTVTASNIQNQFDGILKVSARLNINDEITIGSRKDEPLLNDIFQKVIENIDNKEVRDIVNRWITVKESVKIDYTFLWKIFIVIFVVFVFFAMYSYQLKRNNEKLKQLSREDALTKIGNRLKLNEVLAETYEFSTRCESKFGLILLDIDSFKDLNDTYGHLFGDEVLKKIGSILMKNIRNIDTLGRWGGEEFLIICPNITKDDLIILSEHLRKSIENSALLSKKKITSSFGLSLFDDKQSIEEIIEVADKNLYKAKETGKNKVCLD